MYVLCMCILVTHRGSSASLDSGLVSSVFIVDDFSSCLTAVLDYYIMYSASV